MADRDEAFEKWHELDDGCAIECRETWAECCCHIAKTLGLPECHTAAEVRAAVEEKYTPKPDRLRKVFCGIDVTAQRKRK